MRALLAALLLVLLTAPIATAAEPDRYSGRYAAECSRYVCELDVSPRPDGWTIRWTASDPTVLDAAPRCAFTAEAEIGSAQMGPAGVVTGIAVGRVKGRPFGVFDLGDGSVSWSSSWEACPGIAPKNIYEVFGDQ